MCIVCDGTVDPATIFLDCSRCDKVTTLPDSLPALKFLVIHHTNITSIPKYDSLEGLYCMQCPLEVLPSLPKLRKLNASGSMLKELSNTLYRLETILIDDTKITHIPDTLISAITISANRTGISEISENLINLESLSIIGTAVEAIGILMSLQYLNCSDTQVHNIAVKDMPSLRKVYASGCQLSDPFAIISEGIDLVT